MNLQRERDLLIKKQEDQNDSQRVRTLQRENTQVGEISKFLELYAGVTTMAALLLFCPTTMGSSKLFCTSKASTGVVVVFACTTLTCDQENK